MARFIKVKTRPFETAASMLGEGNEEGAGKLVRKLKEVYSGYVNVKTSFGIHSDCLRAAPSIEYCLYLDKAGHANFNNPFDLAEFVAWLVEGGSHATTNP